MRPTLLLSALLILASPAFAAKPSGDELDAEMNAMDKEADAAGGMVSTPEESRRAKARDAAEMSAAMQKQYVELLGKLAKQRAELRAKVTKQWLEFLESSSKSWVDYNAGGDARSRIDFEKGEIEFEALVPADQKDKAKELAEKKIAEQAKKVLAERVAPVEPSRPAAQAPTVLQGQLETAAGKPVTAKNVDAFVAKEVAPHMVVEDKPVVAGDGKPRIKVKVKIAMVPDHMKVRAKQIAPKVDAAAKKYSLEPELLFALIQTESAFNPRARSAAPAFGLMQLMPKTAAREAYKAVYNQDKIVDPDYLYDPDNNITLGAAYMHLLQSQHFAKVKNEENRRSLSIAAYNCGPGCVRKFVLSKADPDKLSNEELMGVIEGSVPDETKAYVPAVQGRMAGYRDL